MSGIDRIGNVFYVVENIDSALDFYEHKLGLPLKFRDGDRWAALDVAGATLALASAEDAGAAPGSGAVVSLRVSAIAPWMREASRRGVVTGPLMNSAHEQSLRLTDPDGNRLVVYAPAPS